jgi:hypothetical protein
MFINKKEKTVQSFTLFDKGGNRYKYTVSKFTPNAKIEDSFFTFDPKNYPGVELLTYDNRQPLTPSGEQRFFKRPFIRNSAPIIIGGHSPFNLERMESLNVSRTTPDTLQGNKDFSSFDIHSKECIPLVFAHPSLVVPIPYTLYPIPFFVRSCNYKKQVCYFSASLQEVNDARSII